MTSGLQGGLGGTGMSHTRGGGDSCTRAGGRFSAGGDRQIGVISVSDQGLVHMKEESEGGEGRDQLKDLDKVGPL